MKSFIVAFTFLFFTHASFSQVLAPTDVIQGSENAVITDEGRYFVAAQFGVFEVSRQSGSAGSDCQQMDNGLYVCLVLQPEINSQPCFMTGMTSDGVSLFGSCSAGDDATNPDASAFFRMEPGAPGQLASTQSKEYDSAIWYNGMAVADDGAIYMSASSARFPMASIVKLELSGGSELDFTLTDWKIALTEMFPNGIQIEGNQMYYISGKGLYSIEILDNGGAGYPVLRYMVMGFTRVMDDFTILDDELAVSEIELLAEGPNSITYVRKDARWWNMPRKQDSGLIKISSLVEDKNGVIASPGSLVATSFFQGGIHEF